MSASASREICSYERHTCSRPRYQKYKYCAQHVLEDTTSPFSPCQYVSRASGRKCPNPALRSKKANNSPSFCDEHLRELIVKEQHQKKKRKLRKKRKNKVVKDGDPVSAKRRKLVKRLSKYADSSRNTNEESSSDSELEEAHRPVKDDWLLEQSGNQNTNADWDDFDSVNNEVYEPLRYADVLTPEEVVATAQSKLIRLQSLYIEQFKRLFHLLKESRRQYLHERKKELKEEKAGTSRLQDNTITLDEDEIYALATYRKRTGVESLLRRRQLKKREDADASMSNSSTASKPFPVSRCSHISNHTRCKGNCLPYTKYCTSHILEDPHQQMYKKCHTEDCPIPVCYLTTYPYEIKAEGDDNESNEVCYCIVHAPLPDMNIDFEKWKELTEEVEIDVEGSAEVSNVRGLNANMPHQGFKDAMEVENSSTEVKAVADSSDQQNTQNMDISEDASHKIEDSTMATAEINSAAGSSETVAPSTYPTISETGEVKAQSEAGMAVPNASVTESTMEVVEPSTKVKPDNIKRLNSEQTSSNSSSTQFLSDLQDTQSISELEKEVPPTFQSDRAEVSSDKTDIHPQSSLTEQESDTAPVLSTDAGSSSHTKTGTSESPAVISQQIHGSNEPRMLLDPVTGILKSVDEDDTEPTKPEISLISSSSEEITEDDPPVVSTVPASSAFNTTPVYMGRRGERKPSSADEQMAVVSLLALCSGHPSDDNTPSSSAEQE